MKNMESNIFRVTTLIRGDNFKIRDVRNLEEKKISPHIKRMKRIKYNQVSHIKGRGKQEMRRKILKSMPLRVFITKLADDEQS